MSSRGPYISGQYACLQQSASHGEGTTSGTLGFCESTFATGTSALAEVSGALSSVTGGGGTSINLINDRTILTGAADIANTYTYTLTVYDDAGYSAVQYDTVAPGRANFSLAASRYGAAFGGIAKGTQSNPLLESYYLAKFYAGIDVDPNWAYLTVNSGVTTPEDGFYCSGKIKVDGDTIKCWGNPHKAETMAQALQNSCNPVFVELALRMGTERFYQYLHAFGLGSKTHIDLQGEESGILIPVNSVKNVDLARIGFGQSVAVTPVQLLTAACSVVNGGRLMRPYLLKEAVSPDGTVLYRTSPKVVSNPISEETSLTMRKLLEDVVAIGGAKNARIPGYRIGGKTGTAQVYKDGRIVRNVHIGSFLGFAPADDPRIALLVIVDEADTPVDYGGTTAAPFARQILEDVLPYLGYQPDGDDGSEPVQVPDVTGLPLWEARKTLSALGLKVLDDGGSGSVTAQMPSAGAKLRTGGQMMLYTYEEALPETETLVCVPDVSGKSIASAASLLRQRGLEMEIDGSGFAVSQEPAAGSFLAPDSVVLVHFELPNP